MTKYEPLGAYLRGQTLSRIPMTFAEIERILEGRLPNSKKYPAWWSNNPTNNVMTRQWLDAGYQTESVDIASEKLVFRRVRDGGSPTPAAPAPIVPTPVPGGGGATPTVHPIFGCMKGTLTLLSGSDPAAPADAEWGRVYERR